MTVRNIAHYRNSLWNWAMFDGCFDNPHIALMDIDGALERNGYALMIETKSPGAKLPRGQQITFYNLCRVTTTVVVVWGLPQQPEECQIFHQGRIRDPIPSSEEHLRKVVSNWYKWASDQPPAWTLLRRPEAQTVGHR